MSVFKCMFKITQSEARAVIDKIEDPIKMTEQGIRDLKKDLQQAMTSLADVKATVTRTRRDAENSKKRAADYERKAMMLLQRMKKGELDPAEADRLATEAMNQKEQNTSNAVRLTKEAEEHEQRANQLQASMNKMNSTITTYENDLVTLKARAKTASATKKLNQQIAKIDSSSTIAMLEKMRGKVEEDESLAAAYGELADVDKSVDNEINAALDDGGPTSTAAQSLLELKEKMGIT